MLQSYLAARQGLSFKTVLLNQTDDLEPTFWPQRPKAVFAWTDAQANPPLTAVTSKNNNH